MIHKNNQNILPVILAGGLGSRVWPFSKNDLPKQFVKLKCGKTLFEKTVDNIIFQQGHNSRIIRHILVVTNEKYRYFCQNLIKSYKIEFSIILEPEKRNTAASVALAAKYCQFFYNESLMLVMSSDHLISNKHKFNDSVKCISNYISKNSESFGMLGVKPSSPSTEYGYLHVSASKVKSLYHVKNFKEKPKIKLAEKYLSAGNYLWNSGIFIFSHKLFNSFIDKDPLFNNLIQTTWDKRKLDGFFVRPDPVTFCKLQSISFDYYFVEKLINLKVEIVATNLTSPWSDLGSWNNLENHIPKSGVTYSFFSKNNMIFSNKENVLIGVSNLIIYHDEDILLVTDKKKLNENPDLINNLLHQHPKLSQNLHIFQRPWGFYEVLDAKKNFLTKKITVLPKSKLSLQKHNYRFEHWIVLSGIATVQIEKKFIKLKKNQSIDIPVKKIHRLINETNKNLELIEVQSGSYIGEDDIERIDDEYKR